MAFGMYGALVRVPQNFASLAVWTRFAHIHILPRAACLPAPLCFARMVFPSCFTVFVAFPAFVLLCDLLRRRRCRSRPSEWPHALVGDLRGDEGVLATVVANGQVLLVPMLPVALQPAVRDGSDESALAGLVQVIWGSMRETAGRIRVRRESAHAGCRMLCVRMPAYGLLGDSGVAQNVRLV